MIDPIRCLGSLGVCNLNEQLETYIKLSLSKNTWSSYSSGWNNLKKFESEMKLSLKWPLDVHVCRAFVVWCLSKKQLKASTVRLYLSAVKLAHVIQALTSVDFVKDSIIVLLLNGAENIESQPTRMRRAMTLDLMLILGHKIAVSAWSKISKQVVWAACTLSFFTSARLGEILAAQKTKFDHFSTLTWENVLFLDKDEILIYIPSTKTSTRGEFVDLFPIHGHPCCPVAALKKLKCLNETSKKEEPVFTFASGSYLTTNTMNVLLKELLKDVCSDSDSISCHSFRAALATAICAWPDKFVVNELQEWSRWRGSSFLAYYRSYRDQRRKLFEKIVKILK
jgi:Phage integrase, N-terminal SAM-like domain